MTGATVYVTPVVPVQRVACPVIDPVTPSCAGTETAADITLPHFPLIEAVAVTICV